MPGKMQMSWSYDMHLFKHKKNFMYLCIYENIFSLYIYENCYQSVRFGFFFLKKRAKLALFMFNIGPNAKR